MEPLLSEMKAWLLWSGRVRERDAAGAIRARAKRTATCSRRRVERPGADLVQRFLDEECEVRGGKGTTFGPAGRRTPRTAPGRTRAAGARDRTGTSRGCAGGPGSVSARRSPASKTRTAGRAGASVPVVAARGRGRPVIPAPARVRRRPAPPPASRPRKPADGPRVASCTPENATGPNREGAGGSTRGAGRPGGEGRRSADAYAVARGSVPARPPGASWGVARTWSAIAAATASVTAPSPIRMMVFRVICLSQEDGTPG